MSYILLALAIGLEILATTLLKYSEGFSKLWPTIGCAAAYFLCYLCFSRALNSINLGVAYATWCGVGIIATAIISWFVFGQKLSPIGMIGLVMIVAGCILMNLFGTAK